MAEFSKHIMTSNPEVRIPSFGFIGGMASGKSTYADKLRATIHDEFGKPVYRPSFSSKIMDIAKDLFDMEGKDRVLLGQIGLAMRQVDPHVWTKYVARLIRKEGQFPFAVDGLRFQHDVDIFEQNFNDFIIVRVDTDENHRMGVYKRTYGHYPSVEELNNKSEGDALVLPFGMRLFNEYKPEVLASQVHGITDSIKDGSIWNILREESIRMIANATSKQSQSKTFSQRYIYY